MENSHPLKNCATCKHRPTDWAPARPDDPSLMAFCEAFFYTIEIANRKGTDLYFHKGEPITDCTGWEGKDS